MGGQPKAIQANVFIADDRPLAPSMSTPDRPFGRWYVSALTLVAAVVAVAALSHASKTPQDLRLAFVDSR
jgi:hypothetical protein